MTKGTLEKIIGILNQAAQNREDWATGADTELGAGHDPTPEQSKQRRKTYLADAHYLRSLAQVVQTREWPTEDSDGHELHPIGWIADATRLVCSGTAINIRSLEETKSAE